MMRTSNDPQVDIHKHIVVNNNTAFRISKRSLYWLSSSSDTVRNFLDSYTY